MSAESRPPVQAVLFDRDGTLVADVPYNGDPDRVRLLPGAARAVALARAAGLATAVVSNQSGIGRGLLTTGQVDAVNARADRLLGGLDAWLYCPHAPEAGCPCRKPRPGLILTAAARLGVAPARCLVIGDIAADIEAAHAAGARAVLVPNPATAPDEITRYAPLTAPDPLTALHAVLEERTTGRDTSPYASPPLPGTDRPETPRVTSGRGEPARGAQRLGGSAGRRAEARESDERGGGGSDVSHASSCPGGSLDPHQPSTPAPADPSDPSSRGRCDADPNRLKDSGGSSRGAHAFSAPSGSEPAAHGLRAPGGGGLHRPQAPPVSGRPAPRSQTPVGSSGRRTETPGHREPGGSGPEARRASRVSGGQADLGPAGGPADAGGRGGPRGTEARAGLGAHALPAQTEGRHRDDGSRPETTALLRDGRWPR